MANQIIYLNGPSSAGKSTLARELQRRLSPPYLHVGIDWMIRAMPPHVNDWTGGPAPLGFGWTSGVDADGRTTRELTVGPYARRVADAFPSVVGHLAGLGLNLIIDDVATTTRERDEWRRVLGGFVVFRVAVTAAFDTLDARERARGDRALGTARSQARAMCHDDALDLTVDTTDGDLERMTGEVLRALAKSLA